MENENDAVAEAVTTYVSLPLVLSPSPMLTSALAVVKVNDSQCA